MTKYLVSFDNNGETIQIEYFTSSTLEEFTTQIQNELNVNVVPFIAYNASIIEIKEI